MGGHALFNIVDLAMVGAYRGDKVQGPVADASIVLTVPIVFMNGISNGTVTVIARWFAAGKHRRANQAARQALLLSVALSALLGVVPAFFSDTIASAFGLRAGTPSHAL